MVFTSCERNWGSILTLCSMIKCQVKRRNARSYRLQLQFQCEKSSSFWSLGSRMCLLYLSLLGSVWSTGTSFTGLLGSWRSIVWEVNQSQFVCECACVSGAVRPCYIKQCTVLLHLLYRTWNYSVSSGYLRASRNQDFYLVCDHLRKFLKYGSLDLLPSVALLLPTTRSP